jgi:hypothetical protein
MLARTAAYSVYLREEYRHEHEMRLFRNFGHGLDDQQGTGQLIVFYCAYISLKHPHLAELVLEPPEELPPISKATTLWIPYDFILLITTAEGTPVSFETASAPPYAT